MMLCRVSEMLREFAGSDYSRCVPIEDGILIGRWYSYPGGALIQGFALEQYKPVYCTYENLNQGLSQDLEIGCPKLAIVKFWGDFFSRETTIYSDYNHKYVFT